MLDGILRLTIVLILMDGGRKIKGKVLVNDMVDPIGEGFLGVKKAKLLWGNGG